MTWFMIAMVIVNIVLAVGMVILWKRSFGRPKDDPRLSRGLQLLQSKISVLEDLSDRTDRQVKQLIELMESKTRQIQNKINTSEKQIQRIDQSMRKSMEVANIFQDKIPHEEIIKRQTSVKYIQAAQLAHKGKSVDDIVEVVGLPRGEVEFIAKVNRKELVFDESNLPAWANSWNGDKSDGYFDRYSVDQLNSSTGDTSKAYADAFEVPKVDFSEMEKMGVDFKETCKTIDEADQAVEARRAKRQETKEQVIATAEKSIQSMTDKLNTIVEKSKTGLKRPEKPSKIIVSDELEVRPVDFPVIRDRESHES